MKRNENFLNARLRTFSSTLMMLKLMNALKGGKKAMNKMDTRIRELESELDAEKPSIWRVGLLCSQKPLQV
jgi:uncharacterized protein Yka (UPF0111/DUF47 family)